jgi:metal-sulfur cluster biosynthetic enzyme
VSVTTRVLQAISDELAERNLDDCAGGVVQIVVKLDAAGCPRRIAIRTEVEREVERRRPQALAI